MPGFFDASCPKCGKRFGWSGEITNRPPCPRCGHQIDMAALEADQKEMEAFRDLLLSKPTAELCGKQRVAAGLSLRTAAKLLGVTPSLLSDIENGRTELSAEMAQKMASMYDVG